MSNTRVLTVGNNVKVLISYSTVVACIVEGEAYKTAKKWSRTTSKHINQFFRDEFLIPSEAMEQPQAFFDDLITIKK